MPAADVPAPAIPGYTIDRALGSGAHGHVWLARETTGLERPVALKVFAPEQRVAFTRELEAARQVEELRRRERVVGLVQALGSGEHEGRGWLALEYLERGSLADRVAREGPLAPAVALDLVRQAGAALELLHRGGVFHRDVKPANLLVGADGQVKLADFGLSRPLDGTLSAAGSPAFAAPEVIAAKPVSGVLADVYSLGATLAFLLTGETILPGRPDVFALERRSVPRALQRAIVAATATDPRERPATVETWLVALSKENQEIDRGKSGSPDSLSGTNAPREPAMNEAEKDVATAELHPVARALACARCQESLEPGQEWVACWACLARHHAACWDEKAACATCAHDRFLPATSAQRTASPLRRGLARVARTFRLPAFGLFLFVGGPVLGLALTVVGMTRSYDTIATLKSPTPQDLAAGVYGSLLGTLGGFAVALVGALLFVAWLVHYLTARKAPRARAGAGR